MSKKIVILGGGFGGLRTALTLSKKLKHLPSKGEYEVVLVDRYPYHTFTPLLYEAATTSQEIADYLELKSLVTYRLETLLQNKNISCVKDKVLHIDIKERIAHLEKSKIQFDYLVLGLGSETSFFNIPGLKENALTLKTFDDAVAIRNLVLSRIEDGGEDINIIIGGGGSTGVELAAELRGWISQIEQGAKQKCSVNIKIVEASPTVMYGFDKKIIAKVERRLTKLGVEIIAGAPIKEVGKNKVILENRDPLPYNILIWTGGVQASTITKKLPVKTEKRGRIEVVSGQECLPESPDLKVYEHIYAIGDIACVYDPITKKPIPQVARAAIEQGEIAAKNIIEDIKKDNRLTKSAKQYVYKPKNYPYIIPVGGKYAVAKFGPIVVAGFLGWILKGLVELNYLRSIMDFGKALKIWLKGLWVFIQNDRLG